MDKRKEPFDKINSFRIRLRKPNDSLFIPNSYVKVPLTEYKIDDTPPGISLILKRKRGTNELIVQSIEYSQDPLSIARKIWTIKEAKTWFVKNKKELLAFSVDLEKIVKEKI